MTHKFIMIGRYATGKKINLTLNKAVNTEVNKRNGTQTMITLKLKRQTANKLGFKSPTKKLIIFFAKIKAGSKKIINIIEENIKKLTVKSNPAFSLLFSLRCVTILTSGGET